MAYTYTKGEVPKAFSDIFVRVLDNLAANDFDDVGKFVQGLGNQVVSSNVGGFGAIDVIEGESVIKIVADVPGTSKKDVKLDLVKSGNHYVLKLTASRLLDKEVREVHVSKKERFYGTKVREVSLPLDIDANSVQAVHVDGVLRVSINRLSNSAQTTSIPIL